MIRSLLVSFSGSQAFAELLLDVLVEHILREHQTPASNACNGELAFSDESVDGARGNTKVLCGLLPRQKIRHSISN